MLRESDPSSETAFSEALDQARLRLQPPVQPDRAWPAVAAAALFAIAALVFAAASVLAPPVELTSASKTSVR